MPWSMKKRRPMVAPGWISIPVTARTICISTRAGPRSAGRAHIRCATRCAQMACRPEYTSAFSRSPRAAGSWARALRRSSRSTANSAMTVSVPDVFEQRCGHVAFAEVGDDHHEHLPGVLRTLRHLQCGPHVGPRRDAAQDALLGGQRTRDGDRVLESGVDDLVVDIAVEHLGDEVRPDALDLVRTGLATV